ncbi:MAG TPA: HDOD domain-containing protein [Oligoflexia bacterium]|nr:HDOD domain-containing protein [Oligoflexia bacterium]HMP26909.1 HDOD domain-containing protein [Oligoflexia bacterium]
MLIQVANVDRFFTRFAIKELARGLLKTPLETPSLALSKNTNDSVSEKNKRLQRNAERAVGLLRVDQTNLKIIRNGLMELSYVNPQSRETWSHSIEVALVLSSIADEYKFDPKKAFIVGLLHDVGKKDIGDITFGANGDQREKFKLRDEITSNGPGDNPLKIAELKTHPENSFRFLIKNNLKEEAVICLLHHTFQTDPYPSKEKIRELTRDLPYDPESEGIIKFAKLLSVVDFFSARFRNDLRNCRQGFSPKDVLGCFFDCRGDDPALLEMVRVVINSGAFTKEFASAALDQIYQRFSLSLPKVENF